MTADSWINSRYFDNREMRPLFVEELAVHPEPRGKGVGSFVLEQLDHLARTRGCIHLVLDVAENNEPALELYRARHFYELDAMIFMAKKLPAEDELLPLPRLKKARPAQAAPAAAKPRATRQNLGNSRGTRRNLHGGSPSGK